MDPLIRARRGTGSREVDEASAAYDVEYQAALSQAEASAVSGGNASGVLARGLVPGEASPGTLEMGEARADMGPRANPFHSERVKAEVELMRHRPTTLDDDARRLQGEHDETALGDTKLNSLQEPDYAQMKGGPEAPRVARVEPTEEATGVAMGPGSGFERFPAGEPAVQQPLKEQVPGATSGGGELDKQVPGVEEMDSGAYRLGDDQRELIPDEGDRWGRMEALLVQMMEENKGLKRRLELTERESRSHSSWHSGLAPDFSPATFGHRPEMSVQKFAPPDFSSQEAVNFMGGRFDAEGYPISPGGTVIRPPPIPPAATAAPAAAAPLIGRCIVTRCLITPERSGRSYGYEALVAEATKLLKGVSLRALRLDCEVDLTWVRPAGSLELEAVGLELLDRYEDLKSHKAVLSKAEVDDLGKRFRRSIAKAEAGSVMLAVGKVPPPDSSQIFLAFEPSGAVVKNEGSEVRVGDWFGSLSSEYGLQTACFDQGCIGAPGVYETRLMTSSWYLYENLHAVRVDDKTRALLELVQRVDMGSALGRAGWVGNLLSFVQKAWLMWKWEQGRQEEVEERRLILKRLSEEESYRKHVEHDHVPYRKGCPICIAAQGRQRSHWRSGFPGMHSLSADVAGPFVSGQSWDVEASGRDKGKGYKYFLACAYAIPQGYVPEGLETREEDDYEPSECGGLIPDEPENYGDKEVGDLGSADLQSLEEFFRLPGEPPEEKESKERIVVKPPSFLTELGILSREDRWWIRKALYGLPTSPRDWGRYRDAEFRDFFIHWAGKVYRLEQTKSDDALWLVKSFEGEVFGGTTGILVVYVDDLAFFGPKGLCQAFIKAVQAHWKTSEPDWLGADPVTFCGIELTLGSQGYRLTQRAYVQELLNRYQIENESSVPLYKWAEPDGQDVVQAEQVREAQAITGALLWLSTRTRPDLAYVVSRCGQQATKCPEVSIGMGKQALAYLKSTIDMGIDEHAGYFYCLAWGAGCVGSYEAAFYAVQPLVDELIEEDTTVMRALAGRERIAAHLLKVTHLPGEHQLADLGLALLAVLPQVKGQPIEDRLEVGFSWLVWVLTGIFSGVAL
ncbi:RE2, partial [Symbiodinium necroappetens]